MKYSTVLFLSLAAVTSACFGDGLPRVSANATNRFEIVGMRCDGCAHGIAVQLNQLPGVSAATVAFSNKLAIVAFDTNRISAQGLKRAIVEAGYDATLFRPEKSAKR